MKKTLLSLAVVSLLSADTTMCFKENWTDMAKIEAVALSGGKCENKYSVTDMKADDWKVDDIKISSSKSGMSYMYVFKKGEVGTSFAGGNADEISAEIVARVEKKILARQDRVKKEKKAKVIAKKKAHGKNAYISKCQSCHGENAKLEAYNTARALSTLSKEDFRTSLREYDNSVTRGNNSFVMFNIAASITNKDIEDIYTYIQTLK